MSVTVLPLANQVIRQFADFPDVDMKFASKADFETALVGARIPDGWMAYCVAEKAWFYADKVSGLAVAFGTGGGGGTNKFADLTDDARDNASLAGYLDAKADLVGGLVPSSQLPAYIDDVIEGYKLSTAFYEDAGHTIAITGEVGKIYVDLTSGQSNKQYRWSGSAYIQITNGLIASTADVPENASYLYFTNARAIGALLTGYVKASLSRAITVTDSILTAIGILEKKADDNATALANLPFEIGVALSDETTNLTSGTAKGTIRTPTAFTLTTVYASVNTAPTGSSIIVNIKKNGTTIFTTKITIATSSKTSVGGTAYVLDGTIAFAVDDEITFDIDQVGSVVAGKGLKISLKGTRI